MHGTQPSSTSKTSASKLSLQSTRSGLTLKNRVEIIKFVEKNENMGFWKIAPTFGVGKTQIQSIIKKKEENLAAYQINLSKGQNQKREFVKSLQMSGSHHGTGTRCAGHPI